ncbi:GyrI-like domain-containing protein [Leeia sp.]|uniref:AraC family transcriptional regulator n=1 Tax=Leeia sp. TaxID=2884678 RepID=UPI0035B01A11
MMRDARRWQQVWHSLEHHLDQKQGREDLSQLAACSPWHFHRLFSARFGLSVQAFRQGARLQRAAALLAWRPRHSITRIALDLGYDSSASLSRAFRQGFGISPSQFRRQPQWQRWQGVFQPLHTARSAIMFEPDADILIRDFPLTRVAMLPHRGPSALLGESLQRFIAWRKAHHLPPSRYATYNVCYHHPDDVAPEDYRFDLCVAWDGEVADNPQGVVAGTLPGGRCAVLRHIGPDEQLEGAILHLYRHWLPGSGAQLRDAPLFLQRVCLFPDVPAHEAVTDIFLPIQ